MSEPTTAYGSILGHPQRAVAQLRAVAAAHEVPLSPVSNRDAVIAVIAAHLWAATCGTPSLTWVPTASAAPALGGALSKAAGVRVGSPRSRRTDRSPEVTLPAPSTELLEQVETAVRWVRATLPAGQWALVLREAAAILSASPEHRALGAVATLLDDRSALLSVVAGRKPGPRAAKPGPAKAPRGQGRARQQKPPAPPGTATGG